MRWLALVVLLLAAPLWAAVPTFDAASSSTTVADSASLTFAHTVGSGCTNAVLYVIASVDTLSDVVTGITYNSVAMSRVYFEAHSTLTQGSYLYRMIDPPKGSSYNVVASVSPNDGITAAAISVCGVHQTTPERTSSFDCFNEGGGTTWTSPTMASSTTDFAIGWFAADTNTATGTCTSADERVDRAGGHAASTALLVCTKTGASPTTNFTGTNTTSSGQTCMVSVQPLSTKRRSIHMWLGN